MWALPFLTALCPLARGAAYAAEGRRHKPLVEHARGLIGQSTRWLPGRALAMVADSGYAALELLAWCQRLLTPVTSITRLRLDAALLLACPGPRLRARWLPTLSPDDHSCWRRG